MTKINEWLKSDKRTQKVASSFFYLLLLITVLSICFGSSILKWYNPENLISFDAVHYYEIAIKGYEGINIAFFPLFPKIWGYFGLSALGMSMLNAAVFFVFHFYLSEVFKWNNYYHLLTLVLPSGIFFFVPYSEAVFFAAGTMVLMGFHKKWIRLICFGFFVASLSRPSFSVFIPALALLYLMRFELKGFSHIHYLVMIVSVLLGAFVVGFIQFLDTGNWFQFFSVQEEWGNKLQMINLPLFSWGRPYIIKYDGITFLIGIVVGLFCLKQLIGQKRQKSISEATMLSLLYMAGIITLILLFRGGVLFSLNRFVWATPFGMVALVYFMENLKIARFRAIFFWTLLLGLVCYWLLFGSYVHIQTFLKFGALSLTLSLMLFMFVENYPKIKLLTRIAFLLMLFALQSFFFYVYLTGGWIA